MNSKIKKEVYEKWRRSVPSLSIIWKAQGQTRHHTVYIIPMLISNLCRGLDYDVEAPFLRWLYASSAGKNTKKMRFPFDDFIRGPRPVA